MSEALIVPNLNVMMGKPVIAGTRLTVELILEKLAAGPVKNAAQQALKSSRQRDPFRSRGAPRSRPVIKA